LVETWTGKNEAKVENERNPRGPSEEKTRITGWAQKWGKGNTDLKRKGGRTDRWAHGKVSGRIEGPEQREMK